MECPHYGERIGVYEPVRVIDGEGIAVAVSALEVHADPRRYRSRVLHDACAQAAGMRTPRAPGRRSLARDLDSRRTARRPWRAVPCLRAEISPRSAPPGNVESALCGLDVCPAALRAGSPRETSSVWRPGQWPSHWAPDVAARGAVLPRLAPPGAGPASTK